RLGGRASANMPRTGPPRPGRPFLLHDRLLVPMFRVRFATTAPAGTVLVHHVSMEGGSMSTVPTAKAQVRVHIRWMIRRDMPEVLAIEHASFEYPWCEEEFLRVLRQRNCIGMVAEYGERIVGFMIYELHRNKIHVLDFATHPDYRRRGVGRQMILKLVGKLSAQRRNRIALSVRETNL